HARMASLLAPLSAQTHSRRALDLRIEVRGLGPRRPQAPLPRRRPCRRGGARARATDRELYAPHLVPLRMADRTVARRSFRRYGHLRSRPRSDPAVRDKGRKFAATSRQEQPPGHPSLLPTRFPYAGDRTVHGIEFGGTCARNREQGAPRSPRPHDGLPSAQGFEIELRDRRPTAATRSHSALGEGDRRGRPYTVLSGRIAAPPARRDRRRAVRAPWSA